MHKFQTEIAKINEAIESFNCFLHPERQVRCFQLPARSDDDSIVEVIHGSWDAFPFPKNGTGGVYFIFGHEQSNSERNGVYIGKASFGSTTSNRLYNHLCKSRGKDLFTFPGRLGKAYIIDYIAAIDLDEIKLAVMASALEEHLITSLRSSLNLLNGTGN
jgi:hypothetical protein